MKTPSKNDFDEYISVLEHANAIELLDELPRIAPEGAVPVYDWDLEKLANFLERVASLRSRKLEAVQESRIQKWLQRQPTYAQLTRSLYSVSAPKSAKEEAEALRGRTSDLVSTLRLRVRATPSSTVARAFRGYFHEDRPSDIANQNKAFNEALRKVPILTAELNRHLSNIVAGGYEIRVHSELTRRMQRGRVESPIGRMDATVRERALAYDLWRGFRRDFGGNKKAAIVHCLRFDGVQNFIDPRELSRKIVRWSEQLRR
jgi:hypothetical protein